MEFSLYRCVLLFGFRRVTCEEFTEALCQGNHRVIAHKLGITRTHTVRFTLFHSYIQTPKHSYHFPLTATLIPNNTLHLRIFSDAIGRKDSSISIVSPLEQHFLIERASCGSSHSWKLCTKEFYWRYTASWNQVEVA